MIELSLLLFLLLPLAAFSGWWLGQREKGFDKKSLSGFNKDYFKGLNFVLNEQPDKAIEVFIHMLEVDSDTVETHLALGNLFRRRGEVDRAIRIHQNLIARPTLNKQQRSDALLELSMDYMRSGLLDRAEGLFIELVESNLHLAQAYKQLLDIYQQEKEWDKAIKVGRKLTAISNVSYHSIIAQFYCEHAEQAFNEGDMRAVKENLRKAMGFDSSCVRASLIEAKMHQKAGKIKSAIKSYKRIESQNSDYINMVLQPLYQCYFSLNKVELYVDYLKVLVNLYDNISILLLLTELLAEREGEGVAIQFISSELKNRPNVKGVKKLIQYTLACSQGETHMHLKTIGELMRQLIDDHPVYKCSNCGFKATQLHWQCPSCKSWDNVKPVFGVIGE